MSRFFTFSHSRKCCYLDLHSIFHSWAQGSHSFLLFIISTGSWSRRVETVWVTQSHLLSYWGIDVKAPADVLSASIGLQLHLISLFKNPHTGAEIALHDELFDHRKWKSCTKQLQAWERLMKSSWILEGYRNCRLIIPRPKICLTEQFNYCLRSILT